MKFIKYEKLQDFMKENFELLLEKEWLNCLMVGNCLEGEKTGTEGWMLAQIQQNGRTELIILYRKPWKPLLYSPTKIIQQMNYTNSLQNKYINKTTIY